MYVVKRLDLASLDAKIRQQYEALTLPKFHCCLQMKNPNGATPVTIIAIAATWNDEPVGLILATYYDKLHQAEVHSYFVTEAHRRKTIGTQLFQVLEAEARAKPCSFIFVRYPASESYSPYLEQILKHLDWTQPVKNIIHCNFDANTFSPPWWRRDYSYSSSLTVFPWKELTELDREKILSQIRRAVVHYSVSPFKEESTIEHLNSLGFRHEGEVVGWMITHRMDPDTIRYSALYIQPKFQMHGDAIKLLCDALWRHKASGIRYGLCEVNITMTKSKWINFVERRLMPYASSVTYTNIAFRYLKNTK